MNDLFAAPSRDSHVIEFANVAAGSGGANLNRFFDDVESVKEELAELESLYARLQNFHEQSKTLHNAAAIKDLRSRVDADVTTALKKAKVIKPRLEALDRSNAAQRSFPGCGPGSSSDRTRTSVVNGLRKKIQDSMARFNELRQKMSDEYRETVQRRYYTVTGENPDERIVDRLIESGESEKFLQKAIQQQGRGQVMDTIMEIQERADAVKELEKNLVELHQVFLDMAVLVESQGEQLDDIHLNVTRANSYVRGAADQLATARKHQKSTRKWTCYGIILLLIIALIVILSLRPWTWNQNQNQNQNRNSTP